MPRLQVPMCCSQLECRRLLNEVPITLAESSHNQSLYIAVVSDLWTVR